MTRRTSARSEVVHQALAWHLRGRSAMAATAFPLSTSSLRFSDTFPTPDCGTVFPASRRTSLKVPKTLRGDLVRGHYFARCVTAMKAAAIVAMSPDDEKMTRRSPLDFPVEWDRPTPGRRPDIFPQFSPMKTPLPTPLPADPPEKEDDEDEKKDDDPGKEDQPEE